MAGKSKEEGRPSREEVDYPVGAGEWRTLAAEGPPTPRLVPEKYVPGIAGRVEKVGK